jgi:hypothetical protein
MSRQTSLTEMAHFLRFVAIVATTLALLGSWLAAGQVGESPLEGAARRFRIETYRQFRLDRPEYNRRIAVSRRLLDAWRSSGQPSSGGDELRRWHEQATAAARRKLPLPAPPNVNQPSIANAAARDSDVTGVVMEAPPELPARRAITPTHNAQTPAARVFERAGTAAAPVIKQTTPAVSVERAELPTAEGLLESISAAVDVPAAATSNSVATVADVHEPVSVLPPVQINLQLLSQRIAAHNLSIRAIEEQLLASDSWSLDGLELVRAQLGELMQRREVWQLYWEILDSGQRLTLNEPVSLDQLLELFQQRLFETQVSYEYDPRTTAQRGSANALARLRDIAEEVDRWKTNP